MVHFVLLYNAHYIEPGVVKNPKLQHSFCLVCWYNMRLRCSACPVRFLRPGYVFFDDFLFFYAPHGTVRCYSLPALCCCCWVGRRRVRKQPLLLLLVAVLLCTSYYYDVRRTTTYLLRTILLHRRRTAISSA